MIVYETGIFITSIGMDGWNEYKVYEFQYPIWVNDWNGKGE